MSADLRRYPRFVAEEKVEMELLDRKELQEVWTSDISHGGMYIRTDKPPPFGTMIEVRVRTPDGTIKLGGRVVHVVDAQSARAFGQPAGVGVQFVDLTPAMRTQIERYIEGLVARVAEELSVDVDAEPLELLLEQARTITAAIAASDLYGALGLVPSASLKDVQQRVDELCRKFNHPPQECSPPKAARLAQVANQIERAAALFTNPIRRLHFDFKHGHIRVEERRAAGEDLHQLRKIWGDVFPERMTKAKEIARLVIQAEENGKIGDAAVLAAAALDEDPFNEELRRAEARWRTGQSTVPEQPELIEIEEPLELDPSRAMNELLAISRKLPSMANAEVLGLDATASPAAIEQAYLERMRRYDPEALRGHVPLSVLGMATDYHRRLRIAHKALTQPAEEPVADEATLDANTKYEMGLVYLRKKDFAKAREMFRAALELDDDNPEYQASLAWALIVDASIDRGEVMSTAKPLLEQALAKASRKTVAERKRLARYHFFLGRLLRIDGQVVPAKKHFGIAVELDDSLTEAATELRLIEAQKQKKGLFKK